MNTNRATALLTTLDRPRARTGSVLRFRPRRARGEPDVSPKIATHEVLFFVAGPQQGMAFALRGEQTVGRDEEADIVIADGSISRKHARIAYRQDALFIEDLESRNGTFVGGERVRTRKQLRDGDYVRFGPTSLAKLRAMDDIELNALHALRESTLRDPLTRLYNRRYFDERLRSEFSFAKRQRAPLALILIDIDHFKRVNDEHGHQAGDLVLRLVAATIQGIMRPEDVVARYGGEEFIVIARNTTLRNAAIFAERIRSRISHLKAKWEGQELSVTASFGVTAVEGNLGHPSVDSMVHAADEALYAAKARGRNCISTHPDSSSLRGG